MDTHFLSPDRRIRVLTVGITATVSLYALMALIAEPMRALGATTDTETAVVQVTLAAAIGMNCDADGGGSGSGETLALATITEYGDTGPLNATVTVGTNVVQCNIRTNNAAGWDLAWRVTTGSGGFSTGYMINQFENVIDYFESTDETTPTAWNGGTEPADDESAWGGRLSSTSDHFADSPLTWNANAADGTERWLKVSSGSTTVIATGTNATSDTGDNNYIGFRVEVGSDKIQPTGTYRVTVNFTATTQ